MPQATTPKVTPRVHDIQGDSESVPGSVPWLIAKAFELEADRMETQEAIDENRKALRGLDKMKALSDAEGNWLDDFYPVKEKDGQRSEVDLASTRAAKVAGRRMARS